MALRAVRGLKAVALVLCVSIGLWAAWKTLAFCWLARQIAAENAEKAKNARWAAAAAQTERAERKQAEEMAQARQALEAAGANVHLRGDGSIVLVDLSDADCGPEVAEVFVRLLPYFIYWHFRDEHDVHRVVQYPMSSHSFNISLQSVDSPEVMHGVYDLPGVGKIYAPNRGRRLTWILADIHEGTKPPFAHFYGSDALLLANPGRSLVCFCRIRSSQHVLRPVNPFPVTRHYMLIEAPAGVSLTRAAVGTPLDSPAPYYLRMPWEKDRQNVLVIEEFDPFMLRCE